MTPIKIVLADGPGGYWLNEKGYELLGLDWENEVIRPLERNSPGITKQMTPKGFAYDDDRTNPKLVEVVTKALNEGIIIGNPDLVWVFLGGENLVIISDEDGWERLIEKDGG